VTWSSSAPSSTACAAARRPTGWSGGARGDVRALPCWPARARFPLLAVVLAAVAAVPASAWREGRFPCGCERTGDRLKCFPSNSSQPRPGVLLLQMGARCGLASVSPAEALREGLQQPAIHARVGS